MSKIFVVVLVVLFAYSVSAMCLWLGINYGIVPAVKNGGVTFWQSVLILLTFAPVIGWGAKSNNK